MQTPPRLREADAEDAALIDYAAALTPAMDIPAPLQALVDCFEPQIGGAYCGIASACAVLNCLGGRRWADQEGLAAVVREHWWTDREARRCGLTLDQVAALVRGCGADVRVVHGPSARELQDALAGGYVIANFYRVLGGRGGGHFCPVAGADGGRALVVDPQPKRAPIHWVSVETLAALMAREDRCSGLARGFIAVSIPLPSRLRRATVFEAPEILELIRAAFAPVEMVLGRKPSALATTERSLRRNALAGTLLVLEDEDGGGRGRHLVGTVTVKEGHISRLGVSPSCQGHGFGKLLLRAAETLARQSTDIASLTCYGETAPVVKFYEKNGYRLVESREKDGATILSMQKALTGTPDR